MQSSDIVFYKANADGTISNTIIESGVLNSLIRDVSPNIAESGGTVFYKMFYKNTNATLTAYASNICLAKYPDADDEVIFFVGTSNDIVVDETKSYGIVLATSELDRSTKTINISTKGLDPTTIFEVGDAITFIDATTNDKIAKVTIASLTATDITINEDLPPSYTTNGAYIANTYVGGDLASGASLSVWIKQIIPAFSTSMEVPPDSLMFNVIFNG